MNGTKLSIIAALIPVLLLPISAAQVTIDPDIRFLAGDRMVVRVGVSPTTIIVRDGSISIDGFELGADTWTNVTIVSWPLPGASLFRRDFVFGANATPSTAVQFTFSAADDIGPWSVRRDGEIIASGEGDVNFTASEWQSDVNRTFIIRVDFIGEELGWLVQYGPAWAALLVGAGLLFLILGSFWIGIKRGKEKGKIWRYMPRKFRR